MTVESETLSEVKAPKGVEINNVSTVHLSGEDNTNIGYYFPGTPTVKVLKEVRNGNWSDVGPGSGAVTNGYATITFDHGVKPADAGYAYAICPTCGRGNHHNIPRIPI